MPTKDEARAQAVKHVALMKNAFGAETAASVEAAVIYEDPSKLELPEAPFERTETQVTTDFAPNALYSRAQGKTAIVSPASFTKPGGNYMDGSMGPEQVICSESNLYNVLVELKADYHDKNRGYQQGQLFIDRSILVPDVVFSRGGNVRKADIIVIPEPNKTRALENHRSVQEADRAIVSRIESILRIAAAAGAETLIVGAFGCGRSGYTTDQVIGLFQSWIAEHPGAIGRIVFAVPRNSFNAFDAVFGQVEPEPEVVAAPTDEEEDEDYFDISKIELPEGVTFRG